MVMSLQAKLVEEAKTKSYQESGEKVVDSIELSSQTVMNSIRELGKIDNGSVKITRSKQQVKVLYIEADEDYVALQDGRDVQPISFFTITWHDQRFKIIWVYQIHMLLCI